MKGIGRDDDDDDDPDGRMRVSADNNKTAASLLSVPSVERSRRVQIVIKAVTFTLTLVSFEVLSLLTQTMAYIVRYTTLCILCWHPI